MSYDLVTAAVLLLVGVCTFALVIVAPEQKRGPGGRKDDGGTFVFSDGGDSGGSDCDGGPCD